MTKFKHGALESIQPVPSMGQITVHPRSGGRRLQFHFWAATQSAVWASYEPDMTDAKLIAVSNTVPTEVEIPVPRTMYLQFDCPKTVFLRLSAVDQTRIIAEMENHVRPLPTRSGNADFDRMYAIVQMNERRRDAELQKALAGLDARNNGKDEGPPPKKAVRSGDNQGTPRKGKPKAVSKS